MKPKDRITYTDALSRYGGKKGEVVAVVHGGSVIVKFDDIIHAKTVRRVHCRVEESAP